MLGEIKRLLDSGLKLIPLQADKRPISGFRWRDDEATYDVFSEVSFDKVGLRMGPDSGNIECIDIDLKNSLDNKLWWNIQKAIYEENEELYEKLTIQSTMNSGYHLLYVCNEMNPFPSSKKIASRLTTELEKIENPKEKVRVLIETRSSGAYCAIYPSPGYSMICGDIANLKNISYEERNLLITIMARFDQSPQEEVVVKISAIRSFEISPFKDFNDRANFLPILEAEGWRVHHSNSENVFLKRPGKTSSQWSATWSEKRRVFYVFTSSTEFEGEKGYSPVSAYCKMKHMDNWSECAKDLIDQGYGKKIDYANLNSGFSDTTEEKQEQKIEFILPVDFDLQNLQDMRDGKLKMGLTCGFSNLDDYFRFKERDYLVMNGHSSVGKTTLILFLSVIGVVLHGFKFLIWCSENESMSIKSTIMEFWAKAMLKHMTDVVYRQAIAFISENYRFVRNDKLYSGEKLLNIASDEKGKFDFTHFIGDPYHDLVLDIPRGMNSNEYHQSMTARIKMFNRELNCSSWWNHHCYTEASRRVDKDGFSVAPYAEDTEGGGLWKAASDTFLTAHRVTNHSTSWMKTDFIVRKVREWKTGGRPTLSESPIVLTMLHGGVGFTNDMEEDPLNPSTYGWRPNIKPIGQIPSFYNEPKNSGDEPPF